MLTHNNYYEYEWNWLYNMLKKFHKGIDQFSIPEIISLIKNWITSVVSLDEILFEDAKKEFTLTSKTSFGIDGNKGIKEKDFESVRGLFDSNSFVLEVLNHIDKKTELGKTTIEKLSKFHL